MAGFLTEHFSANLQRNTVVHGTGLPLKVLPAAAPLSAVRSSQTTAQAAAVQRHGHWLKWAGKDRWLVLFATGVRQGEAKPLGRRAALQRCWACWKRCTACTATLALSEAGVKHLRWAGVTGQGQRPRVHHRAVRSTPLGPHPPTFRRWDPTPIKAAGLLQSVQMAAPVAYWHTSSESVASIHSSTCHACPQTPLLHDSLHKCPHLVCEGRLGGSLSFEDEIALPG